MYITEKTLTLPPKPLTALNAFLNHGGERFCFFDIETTGLSANVSSLYLIGALWCEGDAGTIHTRQWFADDYTSETEILTAFHDFLSGFTTLVHYNGSGFDIPYIEKKCRELGLPSPFGHINSLDIFREIRGLKTLFGTDNLKLFTVEKLVGFMRKDILTGKDCIQVYSNFMQKKYFRDDTMETERQKLLLHNIEDVIGTYLSAQLLTYRSEGALEHLEETSGVVRATFGMAGTFPFPAMREIPAAREIPGRFPDNEPLRAFILSFEDSCIQLELPLTEGTLLHFFPDYKNYFYLPAEDAAIHKSVGIYVDKQAREPAKASNCYTKKEGLFLPLPAGFEREGLILFRSGFRSRQNYILWDEKARQDASLFEAILRKLL